MYSFIHYISINLFTLFIYSFIHLFDSASIEGSPLKFAVTVATTEGVALAKCVTRVHTFKPRQDGRHFADNILKCIFFNENVWVLIKIALKFVPKGPITCINMPSLVQVTAWHRKGDKPLSEQMMTLDNAA